MRAFIGGAAFGAGVVLAAGAWFVFWAMDVYEDIVRGPV